MRRFKAGIGFGIFIALLIIACEDSFGFKMERDGFAVLIMFAAALGASWADHD